MSNTSPLEQIRLLYDLLANPEERASFLTDPEGYAQKKRITFDPEVKTIVKDALLHLERESARYGMKNPFLADDSALLQGVTIQAPPEITPMNVAAAAAVVSAAAAVVSAAASVTMATSAAKAVK